MRYFETRVLAARSHVAPAFWFKKGCSKNAAAQCKQRFIYLGRADENWNLKWHQPCESRLKLRGVDSSNCSNWQVLTCLHVSCFPATEKLLDTIMARMVEVTLPGVARNLVLSFMKPLLVFSVKKHQIALRSIKKQQPIQPSHSYSLALHLRYPESRIKPWSVHK